MLVYYGLVIDDEIEGHEWAEDKQRRDGGGSGDKGHVDKGVLKMEGHAPQLLIYTVPRRVVKVTF